MTNRIKWHNIKKFRMIDLLRKLRLYVDEKDSLEGFFMLVILPSAVIIFSLNLLQLSSEHYVYLEVKARACLYAGNYEHAEKNTFSL